MTKTKRQCRGCKYQEEGTYRWHLPHDKPPSRAKSKRLALIICLTLLGLVVFYYAMKWTTPPDCIVPANRTKPDCIDFIYPS